MQPGKIMDIRSRKEKGTTGNEENEGMIIDEWRHFDPRKEWERNVTDEQKKGFLDGLNRSGSMHKFSKCRVRKAQSNGQTFRAD